MTQYFGKSGRFYFHIVRGIDNREVRSEREIKSVSVEDTYQDDLTTKEEMLEELMILSGRLVQRLQRSNLKGRTIMVKFKYHDFTISTRSFSLTELTYTKEEIDQVVSTIIESAPIKGKRVRLLGIGVSNFETYLKSNQTDYQLKLF